ncbi:hypothetical protein QL285_014131 [Trifolium repens]|nr:hypothetical protein QL285_014131 [Trifolium repens]
MCVLQTHAHSFFFKKQEKNETRTWCWIQRNYGVGSVAQGSRNWYARSVPIISSVCYGIVFSTFSSDSNTHFIKHHSFNLLLHKN